MILLSQEAIDSEAEEDYTENCGHLITRVELKFTLLRTIPKATRKASELIDDSLMAKEAGRTPPSGNLWPGRLIGYLQHKQWFAFFSELRPGDPVWREGQTMCSGARGRCENISMNEGL